ncbi:MAG: uroporphyrinogen decarboxylase family protein [Spirochaetales bacterium]|nr:uroporphyrinogen decarboxylase family protein [Spirochaetales bacterium]
MSSARQRFGDLMSGQLPDRVPVVCNLLEQGAKEMGMSIKDYYSKGENVAYGQIRLIEKYGHDVAWAFHYTASDAEMLGSKKSIFPDDGPPNVGHLIIKSIEDIHKLKIDSRIFNTKSHQELLKTIDILKTELGKEYPILSAVVGSYSMPAILMGIEKWMELLFTPQAGEAVNLLYEKCSQFVNLRCQALLEAGVDMIIYNNPLASAAFITADEFKKKALPWIHKDVQTTGTAGMVYFNGGGEINPMLPALVEHSGFGAFYINPMDDIREAKQIVNGKGLVAAPINDIKLLRFNEEEVKNEVERIISEGKEGGGFIFGTLVMPYGIPEHTIRSMINVAKQAGQY